MTRAQAERTLARLHEAQAAFYAGGPREPLHDVLTDDIVWVVPGANAIAGEYRGLDAVIDYFTRRRTVADRSFRMHPGEVLVGDGEHVARFMVGIARPDRGIRAVTLHPVLVNGVPGRVARDAEGNAVAVLALDVADGLVTAVRIVANPDKLAHLKTS